jgi:hypothetical protein
MFNGALLCADCYAALSTPLLTFLSYLFNPYVYSSSFTDSYGTWDKNNYINHPDIQQRFFDVAAKNRRQVITVPSMANGVITYSTYVRTGPYFLDTTTNISKDSANQLSKYPHKCPYCGGPAYLGLANVDCMNNCKG